MAIVGPRLDTAALLRTARRAVPGAHVTLRSRVLATISGAPLPHGGFVTFAQGAAAAVGVQPAGARAHAGAHRPVPGADAGPAGHHGPGTGPVAPDHGGGDAAGDRWPPRWAGRRARWSWCRWSGPAVDLAAFTGMPVTVPLHANLVAIAVAAAGLLLLAGLTLAVQYRLARGRGTAQALRVGE